MGCKQPYEPPPIKAANQFLVVDGVINASPNSTTTIVLSRTRNLTDTFLTSPEKFAVVAIEAAGGGSFRLQEQPNGIYTIENLTLNKNEKYRLHITTNRTEYISEFVPVKDTPPIDSITWKKGVDVTIYANTHDPSNNSRYYRWDFTETWQYQSQLETSLGVQDGLIFFRDSTNQVFNCWKDRGSTDIVLASSIKLAQDVIDHVPITVVSSNSEKIAIRYSMLVRQYALTEEAFKYWEILKENTQSLGTLFDKQPGQLRSNLHNLADPNEPVIGFVSACSIQERRMFINNAEVSPWPGALPGIDCQVLFIPQDPNFQVFNYPDTNYAPYYFTSGAIVITKKECLDCRVRAGGTNQKPPFW
jgi:hypothetical protein